MIAKLDDLGTWESRVNDILKASRLDPSIRRRWMEGRGVVSCVHYALIDVYSDGLVMRLRGGDGSLHDVSVGDEVVFIGDNDHINTDGTYLFQLCSVMRVLPKPTILEW